MGELAKNADLGGPIGNGIPQLVQRLEDSDWSVRSAVVNTMTEFVKNGYFTGALDTLVSKLFHILINMGPSTSIADFDPLSVLYQSSKLHGTIKKVFLPHMPSLHNRGSPLWMSVVKLAQNLLCSNELASFILTSIWHSTCTRTESSRGYSRLDLPSLIKKSDVLEEQGIAEALILLSNTSFKVLHEPLQSLSLMEILLCGSEPLVSIFLAILDNSTAGQRFSETLLALSRKAVLRALVDLSKERKVTFRKQRRLHDCIRGAIPNVIRLLESLDPGICSATGKALGQLAKEAYLCGPIGSAMPQLVQRLEHSDWSVREAVVNTMGELAKNADLRGPIGNVIPQLVQLLEHSDSSVREAV
ncbi:ARM repeat-containing protein, partial [Serendipita vermifera]